MVERQKGRKGKKRQGGKKVRNRRKGIMERQKGNQNDEKASGKKGAGR